MQFNETQVTGELAQELGLSVREFNLIKEQLGRTPNITELNIYSVMWSERCSYKNATQWLRTLPSESRHLLSGRESRELNLIDIGDGLACALNMTSRSLRHVVDQKAGITTEEASPHSALIANGIRPLALLHTFRMGSLEKKEHQDHLHAAVERMSHYGNTCGIPTLDNEVFFDPSYHQNPVLNTLAIGLTKIENAKPTLGSLSQQVVFLAAPSQGPGHPGDPFTEKRMLEACLEAIQHKAVLDIQPIYQGGIGSAAARLGWRTQTGIQIRLDFTTSEEFPYSSHPGSWLLIGKEDQEQLLQEIFQKWDLFCEPVGNLTDSGQLEIYYQDQRIAELNPSFLAGPGGPPPLQKAFEKPEYLQLIKKYNPNRIAKPTDYLEVAKRLWLSPNIISRKWVYEQYDSTLGTNTLNNPISDAGVLRIKNTKKALTLSMDCNPYYVYADPYIGAMIAVCESARNISCIGGEARALTYGLNFGDPDNPEEYWQFVNAIKGIGDACRKFELGITNGDVRFHTSNDKVTEEMHPILPMPIIGMMGIVDDLDNLMSAHFKEESHQIYMLGTPHNDFGSSEYLRLIHDVHESPSPKFELDEEYHNLYNLKIIIKKKLIQSAHPISKGGLMVSLLEAAIPLGLGFDVETDTNFRKDAYLFGESQSRIIVTVSLDNEDELVNYLNSHNVSFSKLGEVRGHRIIIDNQDFGLINEWKSIHENTLALKLDN